MYMVLVFQMYSDLYNIFRDWMIFFNLDFMKILDNCI